MKKKNIQNSDSVIKYRLLHLWGAMERSGKNEFQYREDFEAWAEMSGYKPWKVLTLIDEDSGYSKDNCLWGFDKRTRGEIVEISEDDSQRNVCKIIKRIAFDLEETKGKVMVLNQLSSELMGSKQLESKEMVKDLCKDLDRALKYINDCTKELDKINLKK